MMPAAPRYAVLPLLAAAAILFTACQPKVPDMTAEEAQHIATLTEHMTTRCVGRYLIDLPESFVLNSQGGTEFEGIKIKLTPMSRQLFDVQLDLREKELQSQHMAGKPDRPVLGRIEKTSLDAGKVFNRAKSIGSLEAARILELKAWKQGYLIEASVEGTDGSFLELDPRVIGTPYEVSVKRVYEEYKDQNDIPQQLAKLLDLYNRIYGRKDTEIPNGPGICFAHGILREAPRDHEELNIAYHLKNAPDLYFDFSHSSSVREDESLLERSAEVEQEMKATGASTLRKSKRNFYGEEYEEWLISGPTPEEVNGTMSELLGNEKVGSPQHPYISLTLLNGFLIPAPPSTAEESAQLKDLTKATLSDAETVALWDKVTPTLRIRPGAF